MGSEWGFLFREKSRNILKFYRTTSVTQVVLKTQKWVSGAYPGTYIEKPENSFIY